MTIAGIVLIAFVSSYVTASFTKKKEHNYPNVCSFYWLLLNYGAVKIGCLIELFHEVLIS